MLQANRFHNVAAVNRNPLFSHILRFPSRVISLKGTYNLIEYPSCDCTENILDMRDEAKLFSALHTSFYKACTIL